MCESQKNQPENNRQSEIDYLESLEVYLNEGWAPTKCPKGCIVELDGLCPHKFKSILLEYGLI